MSLKRRKSSGLVSRKDLLKISIGNADIHKIPVGIIMTRMPNIVTVTPEESAYDAARKIVDHQVDALPVVRIVENESPVKYKVVGKVTKTTITKLFVELEELGGGTMIIDRKSTNSICCF